MEKIKNLIITEERITSEINEKINTVKLILYKDFPEILEKLDFDDDETFCHPLLFAFFRHRSVGTFPVETEKAFLSELLQGYFKKKEKLKLEHLYNSEGIAYVPNLGYFKKGDDTPFSPIVKVNNSSIEILRCPSPLLQVILEIPEEDMKWNDELFNDNIDFLNNAIKYIKEYAPEQFSIIEQCCKSIYLFNTDPENTNSYASGSALGMVFFNIYQKEYDEVFFIDDIAHQSGHVIFNNLIFEIKSFYKEEMDQDLLLKDFDCLKTTIDARTFNVLVHALHTYYTTLLCYNECMKGECFKDNKTQYNETLGRIGFYQLKCKYDLKSLDLIIDHYSGLENIFTKRGIDFIGELKDYFNKINEKWTPITKDFKYDNQEYNFSLKKFSELNTNL